LARGVSRFGVTLHLLNQHFDQGDIIAQAELNEIDEKADRAYLECRSAIQGVELFIEAVKSHDHGWKPLRQTA
ncbi:MAG: formyltransferase family protein, partial [Gammaproteobacteria bacterium]|nr:formyltransferase family protein [Gammaproteobacteria bacterium]